MRISDWSSDVCSSDLVICTRDNDRELLELLKGFFNSSYRKSLSPIIYGVSSFHVVWEHMCVSLLNDFGISENHALIASKPSYNIRGNELNLEPKWRSEESSEGKECVSTCRSQCSQYIKNKTKKDIKYM